MKKFGLVLAFFAMVVMAACGEEIQMGGMDAEVSTQLGAVNITNVNEFPWYGLIITLNGKYSNRLLMDRGNWPYYRSDRAVMPNEERSIPLGNNFVYSEDKYLDSTDAFFETIPFTDTVELIRLEAKSKVDGPYDLRVTKEKR